MVLCLGEPPVRFLWCWLLFFHSFLFFILLLFFIHFQATLPCHRHSTLASQACEGLHQPWALPQLLLIALSFFIYRERYGFEWAFFYPQAFFTLQSFPTFLTQPTFIKVPLGAGSSSLKSLGIHANNPRITDPAHLFVWFTAIHNLNTQENSSLNCTKYYHELLVVKV